MSRLSLLLLLCIAATAYGKAPCDDEMGGDTGTGLKIVMLPTPRRSTPPTAQAWVTPIVSSLVRQNTLVGQAYKKKNCLAGMTYVFSKLCVPQTGQRGSFRVKVRMSSPACGALSVKMRVQKAGSSYSVGVWGRSAS